MGPVLRAWSGRNDTIQPSCNRRCTSLKNVHEEFLEEDPFGTRGGVEHAILSATADRVTVASVCRTLAAAPR